MTSTTNNNNINSNKLFHTYENVGYDDQHQTSMANSNHIVIPSSSSSSSLSNVAPIVATNTGSTSNGIGTFAAATTVNVATSGAVGGGSGAKNITAIESPFADPIIHDTPPPPPPPPPPSSSVGSSITPNPAIAAAATTATTKILSTTDSSGTTRMLTTARVPPAGHTNLVTKLITFPPQSSMDSLKEWSVSTFKCTKQLINEKRGICPVTNDSQLQNDIEQLRENRNKLAQMLRFGQQMTNHYTQLVRTQKQLHSLMNEMSIKCFTNNNNNIQTANNHHSINSSNNISNNNNLSNYTSNKLSSASKQVVANFSSLGNNLSSSTTTTSPTHHHQHHHNNNHHHHHHSSTSSGNASALVENNFENFLPVLNYMRNSNLSLVDDFKKNAITLNLAIKNGEKLIAALNFYCSNLSTLIDKTIEDTLITVKQYELARLEYDAEKNSLNFMSPTGQTSITYSSDKLELARMRYEQHKEDVQIKMKFLEENTIKVMHKQLLIFNGAFASYTSGNTAALDATLKQFSIRDGSS